MRESQKKEEEERKKREEEERKKREEAEKKRKEEAERKKKEEERKRREEEEKKKEEERKKKEEEERKKKEEEERKKKEEEERKRKEEEEERKKKEEEEKGRGRRCPSCGQEGEDQYCGYCGGAMNAEEVEELGGEKYEYEYEGLELRVCAECGEEGTDTFCGNCGGEMVGTGYSVPEGYFDSSNNGEGGVGGYDITSTESYASFGVEERLESLGVEERLESLGVEEGEGEEELPLSSYDPLALLEKEIRKERNFAAEGSYKSEDLQEIESEQVEELQEYEGEEGLEEVEEGYDVEVEKDVRRFSVLHSNKHSPLKPTLKPTPSPTPSPSPSKSNPTSSMKKEKEKEAFIVDLGSFTIKFGWSSDEKASILPASISPNGMTSKTASMSSIGQVFPIDSRNGNFASDNQLFNDLLRNVLKVGSYDTSSPLFLTSSVPLHSEANLDMLDRLIDCDILGDAPSRIFFGYSPLLSLCGMSKSGEVSGLVVDFGHRQTTVVPVYYGYPVQFATRLSGFGGDDLLSFLSELYMTREQFNPSGRKKLSPHALQNALRKCCFVSQAFEVEMKKNGFSPAGMGTKQLVNGWTCTNTNAEQKMEIPDAGGQYVGVERFAVGELYFRPNLFVSTSSCKPLPQLIYEAIASSPRELQVYMMENIVLSGGVSKLAGLADRIKTQLKHLAPQYNINVFTAPENAAFYGAQYVAKDANFERRCITPQEYSYVPLKYKFF